MAVSKSMKCSGKRQPAISRKAAGVEPEGLCLALHPLALRHAQPLRRPGRRPLARSRPASAASACSAPQPAMLRQLFQRSSTLPSSKVTRLPPSVALQHSLKPDHQTAWLRNRSRLELTARAGQGRLTLNVQLAAPARLPGRRWRWRRAIPAGHRERARLQLGHLATNSLQSKGAPRREAVPERHPPIWRPWRRT